MLSERRLQLLNGVASAVMDTNTIDDTLRAAVAACADRPADVPFVAAYVGDPRRRGHVARGDAVGVSAVATDACEVDQVPGGAAGAVGSPGHRRRRRDDRRCPRGVGRRLQTMRCCCRWARTGRRSTARRDESLSPLDDQYVGYCQLLADQFPRRWRPRCPTSSSGSGRTRSPN